MSRRHLALLAALAPLVAVAAPPIERWLEVRVGAVPVGYGHETYETRDAGDVAVTSDTELVFERLGGRVELSERESTLEDALGRLKHLHSELRASAESTVLDVDVEGDALTITTAAGDRRYTRVVHDAAPLLGPEGIRRLTRSRLAAGESQIDYATFVSELGEVVHVTRRLTGRDAAAEPGPLYLLEESSEASPSPTRLRVDADGWVVEEAEDSPFGAMSVRLATPAVREQALAHAPGAEQLYGRSLARANVRLPEPRAIDWLRVRIALGNAGASFPDLRGPGQRVVERDLDHVTVEVARMAPGEGPSPQPGTPGTEPNVILQSDDPQVAALAASLRRPGLGPYAQARVLQDWVAEHLHFDPGLAIVPASEAVRDRRGSCVAYAVLLASLARALGIPAHIVLGYVYVANVWGGHAWTEVRVGDRWIPLDAAVYRAGPADAARLAVVRHSAEQGPTTGAAELMAFLQHESLRIEGYRLRGTTVAVGADAQPYAVTGDRYENRWLGLALDKPPGFRFADTDLAYPETTVVALVAPDGSTIRLHQSSPGSPAQRPGAWLAAEGLGPLTATTVAGRAALRAGRDTRAAIEFRNGEDLWLLEADGGAATGELEAVAHRLTLRPAGRWPTRAP